MTTALTSLVPRFQLMAPLVPQPVALFALREAAIAFCRQTGIVTEILPPIVAMVGVATYAMVPTDSAQMRVVKANAVWADGKAIAPITASELEEDGIDWTVETGSILRYMQMTEGVLRLYKIPEATANISVRASTAPTVTATSVDDALADRWWPALVAGALAQVLMIPEKPFSNPQAAVAHEAAFNGLVSEAKMVAYKGYTKARIRTRAHNF
jgi:hypothetical protein